MTTQDPRRPTGPTPTGQTGPTASLAGRTALVSGAASDIGRAVCATLQGAGATVVATDLPGEKLDALAAELGIEAVPADLTDPELALALGERPVDILASVAGLPVVERFVESDPAGWDLLWQVNLRAPMLVAQHCARGMIARGVRGAIVNVSSIAAQVGTPLHAAYCASKGALDAMTRVMAVELGEHGIRVNAVDPVITLTPMAERAWSDPAKSGPMLARIPLQRFAEPLDVAHAIAWLLGDGAAMINGVSLPVDGGFRAR